MQNGIYKIDILYCNSVSRLNKSESRNDTPQQTRNNVRRLMMFIAMDKIELLILPRKTVSTCKAANLKLPWKMSQQVGKTHFFLFKWWQLMPVSIEIWTPLILSPWERTVERPFLIKTIYVRESNHIMKKYVTCFNSN